MSLYFFIYLILFLFGCMMVGEEKALRHKYRAEEENVIKIYDWI